MAELIAGALTLEANPGLQQINQMIDQGRQWWQERQRETGAQIGQVINSINAKRDKGLQRWGEILREKEYGFVQDSLTANIAEKFNCPPDVAKNLSTLIIEVKKSPAIITEEARIAFQKILRRANLLSTNEKKDLENLVLATANSSPSYKSLLPSVNLKGEGGSAMPSGGEPKEEEPKEPEEKAGGLRRSEKKRELFERPGKGVLLLGGAAGLTILAAIGIYTYAFILPSILERTGGTENLPPTLAEIMNDPKHHEIAQAVRAAESAGIGRDQKASGTDENTYASLPILGKVRQTNSYLDDGGIDQWKNLYAEVNNLPGTGRVSDQQALNILGQYLALQKADCLLGNGHINKTSCEAQHPSFKNAGDQYIEKFNVAIDRLWQSFPSLRPKDIPMNRIERAPGLKQARRAREAGWQKTEAKIRKSTYRLKV